MSMKLRASVRYGPERVKEIQDRVGTAKTGTTTGTSEYNTESTDDENTPLWKKAIPHVALSAATVIYVLFGVVLFSYLEKSDWLENRRALKEELESEKLKTVERILQLGLEGASGASYEEAEKELEAYMVMTYDIYANNNGENDYLLHTERTDSQEPFAKHNDTEAWGLGRLVFWVVGSITTVGFGEIVPSTTGSRIALICYSVIGIPILLITTADYAKFISTLLAYLYERYLTFKHYLREKCCGRIFPMKKRYSDSDGGAIDGTHQEDDFYETDSIVDYLYDNLEDLHEVRVPSIFIFVLLFLYCCLGGYVFSSTELWTFSDSMYFGFIGIMKIGFGDFVPSANVWVALAYNFIGLILTTMCIDVVGVHYLERIHQFGRQMTTADYLALLKEAKLRRKRKETMRRHYETLLMVMKMQLPTPTAVVEEPQPEPSEQDDELKMPQTPTNVRVADLTPYTIKLAWSPAEYDELTEFIVRYNLKHSKTTHTITVRDLTSGCLDLKGLRSFSMYEISMFAVNPIGRSESVRLIQVTGHLTPGVTYAFCTSSVFAKSGHSPISKAVIVTLPLRDDTTTPSTTAVTPSTTGVTPKIESVIFGSIHADSHQNSDHSAIHSHHSIAPSHSSIERNGLQDMEPNDSKQQKLLDDATMRLAKSSSNHSDMLPLSCYGQPLSQANEHTKSLL